MCTRARVVEGLGRLHTTPSEQAARKALDQQVLRMKFGLLGGKDCTPLDGRTPPDQSSLSQCVECEAGPSGACKQWVERTPLSGDETCGGKEECNFEATMVMVKPPLRLPPAATPPAASPAAATTATAATARATTHADTDGNGGR